MNASTLAAPVPTAAASVRTASLPLKVVVLGGRAAGQARLDAADLEDRFVDAVSDLPDPVADAPEAGLVPYGRCAVTDRVAVHLYGLPPQQRYWFMWDGVARGAMAVLVLANAGRLADCFPAVDYAQSSGLPYLVAVAGAGRYPVPQLREALSVPCQVPVLRTDVAAGAHRPRSARDLLHELVRYAVARRYSAVPAA